MYIDSTVFLIEEDSAVRDAITISLAMAGFNVEEYTSGKAFLDAYSGDRPGCILINLRHPEMEGLIMQQEFIRQHISIPIIFMTEIGSICDSALPMQYGAFCLLEKPIPRLLLLENVREAMKQDCESRSALNTR
jgi:two-component system, LuxR family, response regulator FixJ